MDEKNSTEDNNISKAVGLLRANPPDAYYREAVLLTAELLERVAPLAPFWAQRYAAPVVPVIEQAFRLADWIVSNHGPAERPQ